jgi:hypothetical protein
MNRTEKILMCTNHNAFEQDLFICNFALLLFQMYAEIYEKLIPVLAYYGKKEGWQKDLKDAERDLANKGADYGVGWWGWIYASDKFYKDNGSGLAVKRKGNNPKHAVHGGSNGRR